MSEQFDKSRQQDTPRTDANLRGWNNELPGPFVEFTRQLERELAEKTRDFEGAMRGAATLYKKRTPSPPLRSTPEPCSWADHRSSWPCQCGASVPLDCKQKNQQ